MSENPSQKKLVSLKDFVKQYNDGVRQFVNIELEADSVFRGKLAQKTSTYNAGININKIEINSINNVHFHHCNIERIIFSEVDLSNSKFYKCSLKNTSFECCGLDNVAFFSTNLSSTQFAGIISARGVEFDERSAISETTFVRCLPLRKAFDKQFNSALVRRYKVFCPKMYWLWKISLDCGNKPWLLVLWCLFIIFIFGTIFYLNPHSFTFRENKNADFIDCFVHSSGFFVSLDYILEYGVNFFGKCILLLEMLLSYIILGLFASFFSNVFPQKRNF